jgi:hypothetical protein
MHMWGREGVIPTRRTAATSSAGDDVQIERVLPEPSMHSRLIRRATGQPVEEATRSAWG